MNLLYLSDYHEYYDLSYDRTTYEFMKGISMRNLIELIMNRNDLSFDRTTYEFFGGHFNEEPDLRFKMNTFQ